jgi:putative oxidoreductase
MRLLYPVGRLLFVLIFLASAPRHFTHEGITYAATRGVPAAHWLVPLSGAMAIAGGLSIAVGYRARWGAWTLVAFLLPVTWMMHAFWKANDPVEAGIQTAMFVKNVALLGGALLVSQFGAGALSVDERLGRSGAATKIQTNRSTNAAKN